jgi:hypothetical protein
MRILFIALCLLAQTVVAFAANVSLMPVRDLRSGMLGVGKTVIQGDTIEEFNVEILGVQGSESAGYSVLVRLYGDLIDRTGGVAQGMSGSPVYVDGRLVGAVAFGQTFNDPHYCFLTPIGRMLRLLHEPKPVASDWIPKGTSLAAGGFTEYGLSYLRERLQPFGLDAVGSGGVAQESAKPLEPGSAVGAAVLQGDLTIGSLGTVTWTDDEGNVLAFGHPFMQRGNSNYYMTKAWILGVVPNLQTASKVGNIGAPVGSFTQDRTSGIGGRQGKMPQVIPLFVSANDVGRAQAVSMRANVVRDEKLMPTVVDAAVVNTLNKAMERTGGGTAKMRFAINGVDSKKQPLVIERENMFYSADALLKNVNAELNEALSILMQNKFEPVELYGINVEAELSEGVQVAEIVKVQLPKRSARAGEKVAINVTLKPYRGEEFVKTVYFTVPRDYKSSRLPLRVRGGSSMAWVVELLRKQQQEGVPAAKTQEKRRTLADFVKSVNIADRNNEIIVDLSNTQQQSAAKATQEAGLAGLLAGSPYKQSFACDFIVDGESEITLELIGE